MPGEWAERQRRRGRWPAQPQHTLAGLSRAEAHHTRALLVPFPSRLLQMLRQRGPVDLGLRTRTWMGEGKEGRRGVQERECRECREKRSAGRRRPSPLVIAGSEDEQQQQYS